MPLSTNSKSTAPALLAKTRVILSPTATTLAAVAEGLAATLLAVKLVSPVTSVPLILNVNTIVPDDVDKANNWFIVNAYKE